MKTSLRNIPIARKLTMVIAFTCIGALILAGLAIIAYELSTFKKRALKGTLTMAEVVASNSTGAIVFNDPTTAQQILSILRNHPEIASARLYTTGGTPFATFQGDAFLKNPVPDRPLSDREWYEAGRFKVFHTIRLSGEQVGFIYLESDARPLWSRLSLVAIIVLIVILLTVPVIYLISFRIQRVITAPLIELAQTVNDLIQKKDYSIRARRHGEDEIGRLTDSFNSMLEAIQGRDQSLENQRQRLELAQLAGKISSFEWNLNNGEITWSGELEPLFGIKDHELKGTFETWKPLVHPDDIVRTEQTVRRSISDSRDYYIEYRVVAPDKNIIWIAGRGRTFLNEQGRPDRVVGVNIDITEQKKAEQALAQQAELWRSNKDLEQFAYISSHDLKEPLRMVSSFSQLLGRRYASKLDEDARAYIDFIVNGTARMQQLIEDLLSFSLVGRGELKLSEVNLNELMAKVIDDLQSRIAETHGEIKFSRLPVIVADPVQMRQLFQNLVSNALKFRGKDAPRVEVGVHERANFWLFWVKDNGIGIDLQYQDEIFKIFRRLHSQEEYPGTGIGLALCRKIVERHHGRIWIESTVGKGSTFWIELPLAKTVDLIQSSVKISSSQSA